MLDLEALRSAAPPDDPARALAQLVEAGFDRLPMPGAGQTLQRWRVLAEVAAIDLSLAKLFEGHTDALAILHELRAEPPAARSRWGTWCAEPPDARVSLIHSHGARLRGRKAWCSGAAAVTHALVSCWDAEGRPCLAAVAMDAPGVTVTDEDWQAVGMGPSASVGVHFDDAPAVPVGRPGDYLQRPGFWHGGAGIAACWFGGALGIARMSRPGAPKANGEASLRGGAPVLRPDSPNVNAQSPLRESLSIAAAPKSNSIGDPHRLAHLGAIEVSLAGCAAVLREAAAWIDAHPRADAARVALRARLVAEESANAVMQHAGRAVGAGPLCRDRRFARAMADLPVYLRQSHAERDLAALGRHAVEYEEAAAWML